MKVSQSLLNKLKVISQQETESAKFGIDKKWKNLSANMRYKFNLSCQNPECKDYNISQNRTDLHCHHIYLKTTHPQYKYEENNLVVLCKKCHRYAHSFGNKNTIYKKEYFNFINKCSPSFKEWNSVI